MKKKFFVIILSLVFVFASTLQALSKDVQTNNTTKAEMININVVLKTDISPDILAKLNTYGAVKDTMRNIKAVTMNIKSSNLSIIRNLDFVAAANPDAERTGAPVDTVTAQDFSAGLNTWDLDAINVTDYEFGRQVSQDGTGVYVAVLDTGLVDLWRQYFPVERIAVKYAKSFTGGLASTVVAEQPNKWEHDQNSHGTHVTSTILGYNSNGKSINGVAPMATVIPVKVLNQNGSGQSSAVAMGISYIADLKANELKDSPVIINMSLGGPELDAMEKAAIDYAIKVEVIIVAAAGNEGTAGMGYPGAYEPVISVAAAGWSGEWKTDRTWWLNDVADPTNPENFYITDFSSRELAGQDLDVAAPGSWIVGPYQKNSGKTSYYFLGGTSMASPHVAGIAALMAQKKSSLTAQEAEQILESTSTGFTTDKCTVSNPDGTTIEYTWGNDATGAGLVNAAEALDGIN